MENGAENECRAPECGELDAYLLSLPGVESDFKAEWQWQRYMVEGKLFAAVCEPAEKYGVYGGRRLLNLKCDPQYSELLRARYPDILPGFYMDKRCWIAVFLDGAVLAELIRDLCADAHRLVFGKLTKTAQKRIMEAFAQRETPCGTTER